MIIEENDTHKLTVLSDDLTEQAVSITPAQHEKIEVYKSKIDLSSDNSAEYGIVSQNKLASSSETILKQTSLSNITEIDNTLSTLISELKMFDRSISKWSIWSLFESRKSQYLRVNSEYERVEPIIMQIALKLEKQQHTLSVSQKVLEKMFEQNKESFEELSYYIYAGELKLKEINNDLLPQIKSEAQQSGDTGLYANYKNIEERVKKLEQRLHNLKLSKVISMQLAAQIRLIQQNNKILLDKLHSCIVNTLPLWRNQMILSLNISHSQQALETQNTISTLINKSLRKNSKDIRNSSLDVARENARDVVNIKTLQQINEDLLTSIRDVVKIQDEGRSIRSSTETKLLAAENELQQLASSLKY